MSYLNLEKRRAWGRANYAKKRTQILAGIKKARELNPEPFRERGRAWMSANRKKITDYMKNWNTTNREKKRAWHYSKRYGITIDTFRKLLLDQENACAICFEVFVASPHVDHDHKTGKVRGLLCRPCNTSLAVLEKPRIWRMCAAAYLRKHGTET